MGWLQNPIVLGMVNKAAIIFAAWLVHRGTVASTQEAAVENAVSGFLLGFASLALTLWQSYQHKNTKDVLAQVKITNPAAVENAREVVNAPTPNGLQP